MKRILSIILMSIICSVAYSKDLRKLSERKRVKELIKISKETSLKYGDSRYWVDGAEYKIEIIPPNPESSISKKELYRITFTNDFAKKYMEYGYLVSVEMETETGKPVAIAFGIGWGVQIGRAHV